MTSGNLCYFSLVRVFKLSNPRSLPGARETSVRKGMSTPPCQAAHQDRTTTLPSRRGPRHRRSVPNIADVDPRCGSTSPPLLTSTSMCGSVWTTVGTRRCIPQLPTTDPYYQTASLVVWPQPQPCQHLAVTHAPRTSTCSDYPGPASRIGPRH